MGDKSGDCARAPPITMKGAIGGSSPRKYARLQRVAAPVRHLTELGCMPIPHRRSIPAPLCAPPSSHSDSGSPATWASMHICNTCSDSGITSSSSMSPKSSNEPMSLSMPVQKR